MSFKTKLFSLIIVGLLLLPVFINPQKNGQVLGASEVKTESPSQDSVNESAGSSSSSNTGNILSNLKLPKSIPSTDTPKQTKVGEIASGIRDVRTVDVPKDEGKVYTGKAIWDSNAKSSVSTDKFSLGSGISVKYKDKSINLVVGSTRVLSTDTMLVLDKKTFTDLGGNPEVDSYIDVSITLDQ